MHCTLILLYVVDNNVHFLTDRIQPERHTIDLLATTPNTDGKSLWPLFIIQFTKRFQIVLNEKTPSERTKDVNAFYSNPAVSTTIAGIRELIEDNAPKMFGFGDDAEFADLEEAFGTAVWEECIIINRGTEDEDFTVDDEDKAVEQGWHYDAPSHVPALSAFFGLTEKEDDGDYGHADLKDMAKQDYSARGGDASKVHDPKDGPEIIKVNFFLGI